jgi:glycosyltransferase involved in cell wall biosynthesis
MLFVGSLHATDTPNYDSLEWFIDQVLPHIEAELGYETRLTVAGFLAPGLELTRFADHSRVTLLGPVANLEPLYGRHRIVVAPTRFAAGTPYKIYEAASFGVPVAATTLLRDQLGWQDGVELLSAASDDPAAFAREVVRLYRDEALWTTLREGAAERMARENSPEIFTAALLDILHVGDVHSAVQASVA